MSVRLSQNSSVVLKVDKKIVYRDCTLHTVDKTQQLMDGLSHSNNGLLRCSCPEPVVKYFLGSYNTCTRESLWYSRNKNHCEAIQMKPRGEL
mmetsp:Transcript_430/g.977  ORF Transcript_430/g.977 Transcript_430/m.977 type:complete len:92 (-) Transcript_430:13-288(-)